MNAGRTEDISGRVLGGLDLSSHSLTFTAEYMYYDCLSSTSFSL